MFKVREHVDFGWSDFGANIHEDYILLDDYVLTGDWRIVDMMGEKILIIAVKDNRVPSGINWLFEDEFVWIE